MDRDLMKRDYPRLEKIISGLMVIPELTIFQISDFLTLPVRNWVIPKVLKRKFSWLSCREYFQDTALCRPDGKYYHTSLFLFRYICRSYDEGKCVKYRK